MGWFKKQIKKASHAVEKAVDKVGDVVHDVVKDPIGSVEKFVDKTVVDPVSDIYMGAREAVEGTGHLIAGHEDEAKEKFSKSVSNLTESAMNITTGGAANLLAPKTTEKVADFVGKNTVKVADSMIQPTVSAAKAGLKLGEMAYDITKGDWGELQDDFAKMTGNLYKSIVGDAMGGTGKIVAPKLLESSKDLGEMAAYYTTGNFNKGSDRLENLTGWDVDNSIAEEKERTAKAKYQAEVDKANAAEARNRRANLLALRKALVPSLSRSSQGGGGAGYFDEKSQGGITLG